MEIPEQLQFWLNGIVKDLTEFRDKLLTIQDSGDANVNQRISNAIAQAIDQRLEKLNAEPEAAGEEIDLDAAFEKDDAEYVLVPTPEWGGSTHLGSVDAGKSLDFVELNRNPATRKDSTLRLVVMSMIHKDGTRIPEERINEYVEKLKGRNIKVVNRLLDAAMELNGITIKKREEVKNGLSGVSSVVSPTA